MRVNVKERLPLRRERKLCRTVFYYCKKYFDLGGFKWYVCKIANDKRGGNAPERLRQWH